jgi:hypothetical protein
VKASTMPSLLTVATNAFRNRLSSMITTFRSGG